MENKTISQNNPLGFEEIGKLTKKFAIPSIIAMLVSSLYNIVDQLFIGNAIGELGNAATNIVFPITMCCLALALLFGIGGAAAFNLSLGAKDTKNAPYIIGTAVVITTILGFVLTFFCMSFTDPILKLLGCPGSVIPYAHDYLYVTAIGFPIFMLSIAGTHLIRADGSPNMTMIINIIGALINTVLDTIFIFVMDMGIVGAAAATIIGQTVSGIVVIIYLMNFKTVKLQPKHFIPRFKAIGKTASLGAAPFINQVTMMATQIILNNSLSYYGAKSSYGDAIPIAVSGIAMKSFQVFFSIIIGIAQGSQPIASFNYGAKKYDRVKKSYNVSVKAGMFIGIIIFVIFQIFPQQVLGIFGSGSAEYFEFGAKFIRIFMFFSFLAFMQPISSTFFTAIGKPYKGILLSLTRQAFLQIPLILILPIFFGLDGILFATPLSDIISFTICVILICLEFKKPEYANSPKFKFFGTFRKKTTMNGSEM